MRGRVGRGDPDFGSDSFLDIIANLVGILVILIVLAGLRAAQVSVEPDEIEMAAVATDASSVPGFETLAPEASSNMKKSRSPSVADVDVEKRGSKKTEAAVQPNPESTLGEDAVPLELAESQRQELLSAVKGLESRLATLPVDGALADLKAVQSELAVVAGQLPGLQQRLVMEDANRRRSLIEATKFDAEYHALRKQLVEVNQTFEELRTAERPVEEFELRINPVGRRGHGEELLFRIENGRVIHLPATVLFGKAELQSGRLTPLTGVSDLESGTVGPVDGVTLDYETRIVAGMVPTSSGSSTYALHKLMRGTLRVTRLAVPEEWKSSIEEHGTVSRLMLAAPPNAFARLFVTPDSFEAARRVAAFIRTLGHGVATMPIEPGTDIKLTYGNGSDALVQ
ncbi:MAG: hypothetical protein HQ518_09020 [Rhodopirellula sp.]|nr:hypothetical protein [Rhodopirellula sp.]